MTADLSGIIKIPGARLDIEGDTAIKRNTFLGGEYKLETPLAIKGEIYNNGETLSLKARITGTAVTECARCLKRIKVNVDFDINELLSKSDTADKEGDVILFTGHEIDLDDIVTDNFLMNVPGKYLCSKDCKGLCPVCGHDLNEGDCGCERESIDPRWQPLAEALGRDTGGY